MSDTNNLNLIRDQLLNAAETLSTSVKTVEDRLRKSQEFAGKTREVLEAVQTVISERLTDDDRNWRFLQERVLPVIENLSREKGSLRSVLLGKVDHMQGTIDLMREDVRTNWQQADFAISNSRDSREDVTKLISMISTMQRQQNILASQVDELRKAAQERDAGLS